MITGRGKVVSRLMYEELFEYVPQYKLFFDTNEMPRINSTDQALWNRMCVIDFKKRVYDGKDMDKELPGKLRKEHSGILNWCLRGFDEWYQTGLCTPEKVLAATRLQQQEADPYHDFFEDCCRMNPKGEVGTEEFYSAYLMWCERNDVKYPKGKETFRRDIKAREGIIKGSDGARRIYKGVELLPGAYRPKGMTGKHMDDLRR
jgi:putative DNA primase/helicase